MTLLVALLRFAIDLLGVVFLIISVGFSIRTISDWLTEGESVSAWALGAVMSGLAGTAFVVMWLFGSNPALDGIESRLPGPVVASVSWLESKGWGQRVLLTDRHRPFGREPQLARGGSRGAGGGALGVIVGSWLRAPFVGIERAAKRAKAKDDIGVAEASEIERAIVRAIEPRSRTRGLASGSEAEQDVRPAENVQTFAAVISSRPSAAVGTSVKLTAVVTTATGSAAPSGVVVFQRDGVVLGTATLHSGPDGSTASLGTSSLPLGDHNIIARYPGVPGFSPSQSEPIRLVVR